MNFESLLGRLRRQHLEAAGRTARRAARPSALKVESLEAREVPAVLPAPIIDYTTTQGIARDNTGSPNTGDTINIINYQDGTANFTINGAISPTIVANPLDARKLFGVVKMLGVGNVSRIGIISSTDGGDNWSQPSVINNGLDPTATPATFGTPTKFTQVGAPTPVFDRFNNVFLAYTEQNAAGTSGRVVLRKFNFTGGAPGEVSMSPVSNHAVQSQRGMGVGSERVMYQWANTDAAYNVTVAIDNNLASFLDDSADAQADLGVTVAGIAKRTQSDALAASQTTAATTKVFVAWNTFEVAGNVGLGGTFTQSKIRMAASPDGGNNFTPQVTVNDSQFTNEEFTAPKIIFSPGRVGVAGSGGQMVTMFSGDALNRLYADSYDFNLVAGPALELPVAVEQHNTAMKQIDDAFIVTVLNVGDFHVPVSTEYKITVPAASFDPTFVLGKLAVTLSAYHNDLSQIRIDLVAPGSGNALSANPTLNSPDPTINPARLSEVLVWNRVNRDNNVIHNGIAGTALGRLSTDGNNNAFNVGTTFEDNAERRIDEGSNGFAGSFRPENGTLFGAFGGMNFAALTAGGGTWSIIVTDYRDDGTGILNPVPQFGGVTLKMSQNFKDGLGFSAGEFDKTVTGVDPITGATIIRTVTPNSFTGASHPTANAAKPGGVGTSLTLAADATLGAYSPYQGRVYASYFSGTTQVIYSDDAGKTWSNNVAAPGGFNPQIAVDQTTGTVLVSSYSSSADPSLIKQRSLTVLSTAINGPAFGDKTGKLEFSAPAPVNPKDETFDEITRKTLDVEYVSSNGPAMGGPSGNTEGFGTGIGLAAAGGKVQLVYAGNLNRAVAQLRTQEMTITAGPRVVKSDSGVILGVATLANNIDGSTLPYNFVDPVTGATFTGFYVEFDRAVRYNQGAAETLPTNPLWFTKDDILVRYRAPGLDSTNAGDLVDVLDPIPLDGFRDPINNDVNGKANLYGAKRFFVPLVTPQTRAGTYSFVVGNYADAGGTFGATADSNGIADRIRYLDRTTPANPGPTLSMATIGLLASGSQMDQNGDAVRNVSGDDTFAVPASTINNPFVAPFKSQSLPVILPGPHVVASQVHDLTVAVNDKPITIVDQAGAVTTPSVSTIKITEAASTDIVQKLTVTVNVTHGNVGELGLTLTSPGGRVVKLVSQGTLSGANLTNTTFADAAAVGVAVGTTPYTGTFLPVEPLTAFKGSAVDGTWTLTVTDTVAGTVAGTIDNWSLSVQRVSLAANGNIAVSNTTAKAITDRVGATITPTTSTIDITGAAVTDLVKSLTVTVNVTHGNVGDLGLTLTSPDGRVVKLVSQGTLSGADLTNTTFDDTAFVGIAAGSAPYTGSFVPAEPLTSFNLGAVNGTWTLTVTDSVAGTAGTLDNWSLAIKRQTAAADLMYNKVANAIDVRFDRVMNTATVSTADALRLIGPAGDLPLSGLAVFPITDLGGVAVAPATANSKFYRITFPDRPIPGQYQVQLGSDIAAQVAVITDRAGAVITPTTSMIAVASPVSVPNDNIIQDVSVKVNITHAIVADLALSLTSPGGQTVRLVRQGDATSANFTDTIFAKAGTQTVAAAGAAAPYTATYLPVDAMGGFDTFAVNGNWTLTVTDGVTGVQGTLNDWALTITTASGRSISTAAAAKMDKDTNAGVNVLLGTAPGGLVIPTSTGGDGVIEQAYGGAVSLSVPADAVPRFLLLDINGPTDGYQIQKLTATITAAVAAGRTLRDLEITLVSPKNVVPVTPSNPNGTVSVVLMKDAPRTGPDTTITNVTFTDDPATPVQSGIAAAGGKNNPVDVLANFLSLGILAKGKWNLQVINRGTAAATISKFALTLDKPVLRVGLGDTVADQSSLGFRVFYSDELAATGNKDWVPVGPDGNTQGATTNGRVSSVAVDPSDASGNTVYAAGASGGLWRTTNFLTRDVKGPTWVPLTDFGPNQEVNGKTGSAINVGSITVINETGDPLQSKIIVGTGSAALNIIDTQQQPADRLRFNGVGFLYSEDAGKTWNVLDSTKNYAVPTGSPPNTAPKFLPVADVQRDHLFVGAVVNKVVAEKKIVQNSDLNILYAAVGAGATPAADQVAGLWRSLDSGRTWQQIYRDANGNDVTDFVIGEGSAQQDPGGSGSGSFLHPTIGYVAVEGVGVLTTSNLNAQAGVQFNLINGGVGRPTISQFNPVGPPEGSVPVGASLLPNGSKARIVLAAPSFQSGNTFANNYYQGWLVAAVSGAGGNFDGLYITKDQGLNWTRVRLTGTKGTNGFGLNAYGFADTAPDLEQALSVQTLSGGGADHSLSIAMDPTDPNIVYVAGFNNIRVDLTQVNDPYKLQLYSHTDATGNPMTTTSDSNTAGVGGGGLSALDATRSFIPLTSTTPIDDAYDDSLRGTDNIPPLTLPLRRRWNFLNLKYDPYTPFDQDTTLITSALTGFTNNGNDAPWAFTPTDDEYAASIVTYVDPVTGKARVIFTHDDGISTFVANPDGTSDPQDGFNQLNQNLGGGTNLVVGGTRNGNIQVARFYSGDVQPSKTAADIANAMFYGASRKVGDVYTGAADLMDTGDQSWSEIGRAGRTNYVTTDPGGSGTVYILRRINNIGLGTDFFQIQQAGSTPISRTFGLFIGDAALGYTATDDAQGVGQWRNDVRRFAVNPIDKLAITMGSSVGRLFSTVDQGRGWFVSAQPSELDGTYVGAVAYGAPGSQSAGVNAYLYAGTAGGKIYVKTGNSLAPQWKNISANLDGSPIQKIVANPLRGSNSAYAVTDNGVYYMADWASANVALNKWKNISGNLFAITHQAFGLGADYETTLLQRLSTIAVDWRPLNFFTPGTPVLYAGGDGGVYRSLDNGNSWNRFTDATTNGLSEGGGLPNVKVTDLDLAIGDVIQNTGRNNPAAAALPNQLVATTLGRGSWAIELITPNDQPIIDPITDVTVLEDSAQKTVNLTGISPGQGEVTQTLTITAVATDPVTGLPSTVITPPVVTYMNPAAAGTLTFTPVANKNGDVLITITEKDDGGVLGGGNDTRVVTFLVHVTPVNDRPTLNKPTDLVINEDAGQQTVTLTGLSDGEPAIPNEGQILTVTATSNPAGALIIPNPVVTYVNGQPTAVLKFTPNLDQFTSGTPVTITVTAKDNAGGLDTKTQTFTVTVTSVNDAPSFTVGPDIYTNKNAPAQTFASFITNIKKGPSNENGQTVSFNVTNNNGGLFDVKPEIDPFGTLTYTPKANASGVVLVSVSLTDNGGGVAPNVDTSATQTFVIQLGVNRAPVLDTNFNPELLPIGQGTTTSAGTLVSALLGTAFSDPDPNSPQGIAVIGVSNVADGVWEFSTDDGVTWQNLESASLTTAVMLRSQDRVRFNNPTPSFLGQPTITYHAWDQSVGAFGGTANLFGNTGGSSPFSTASEFATAFVAKLLATFPEDGGPAKLTLKGTALTGISFTSISDNDTKAKKGVAVVGVGGEIPGLWQYSINNGTTWLDFGAVGPTAARLLRETDKVRFLPAANRSGETFIRVAAWDQTSGLPGKTADLTAAGARDGSKAFSVLDAFFVVRILPLNDQPVIDAAAANFLTQIPPNAPADDTTAFGPAGDRVSDVLGSVATDQDAGSALGMAVSAVSKIGGVWQYRAPADTIWQGFPILPVANVFLLKPDDFIRFKPDGATEGTAKITYKAWDRTFGARLAILMPAATNTAFSPGAGVAKVVVSSGPMPTANVPPMLDNAPARSFTAVLEDTKAPAGNAVSVFAATVTAITDTVGALKGIAVTGVTGDTAGTWQFSLNNGVSWLPVGAVGTGYARLLKDTDKLRYVPRANFNGTDIASVKYRAWDRTVGTAGKLANLTTLTADSPFSAAVTEETATLTVTPVNDAPVLDIKPLAIVTPTAAGSGVAQLLGTAFSDIDGPAQGIAVTSISTVNGRWQFSTNFGAPTPTWNDIVNVNPTNFLFLNGAGGVRFVPTTATVDAFIMFKAWDQSAGVAGLVNAVNATTPALKRSLSLATEKATAKATAGNDAPVLDVTPVVQLPSVAVETDTTPDTTPASATGVLTLLANATDSDAADFKGIAVIAADQTHGNWEFYDGTTWFSLGGVTVGNAVLLDSTYKIRFTPNVGFSGTSTFKYKAWDQTFGVPKDVVSTLGSTAFSTAFETASIAVNTAPVLLV